MKLILKTVIFLKKQQITKQICLILCGLNLYTLYSRVPLRPLPGWGVGMGEGVSVQCALLVSTLLLMKICE